MNFGVPYWLATSEIDEQLARSHSAIRTAAALPILAGLRYTLS